MSTDLSTGSAGAGLARSDRHKPSRKPTPSRDPYVENREAFSTGKIEALSDWKAGHPTAPAERRRTNTAWSTLRRPAFRRRRLHARPLVQHSEPRASCWANSDAACADIKWCGCGWQRVPQRIGHASFRVGAIFRGGHPRPESAAVASRACRHVSIQDGGYEGASGESIRATVQSALSTFSASHCATASLNCSTQSTITQWEALKDSALQPAVTLRHCSHSSDWNWNGLCRPYA